MISEQKAHEQLQKWFSEYREQNPGKEDRAIDVLLWLAGKEISSSEEKEREAVAFSEWSNDLNKCEYYPVYDRYTDKLEYWEKRDNPDIEKSTSDLYKAWKESLTGKE